MDRAFGDIWFLLQPEEKSPFGCPAPLSAPTQKARSRNVNINPVSTPPLSSRFGLFTSPESLFTFPESLFTSSWNLYSHRPGIGIHMPRNTHDGHNPPGHSSELFQTAQRAAWRNQERSIQPTPCAQIEQPWILRPLPRRHVSRSQPGCRQPRKLLEGSFQAGKGAGAEASRLEPLHRS